MSLEQIRAECLHRGHRRLALLFMPAVLCVLIVLAGAWASAVLLFCTVSIILMLGTLVSSCAWFGPLVKRQPSGSKHPLLTIDDGPHPQHTPAILEILDRHGLKAIFFLIGERADRHPELVREIVRRGHEVGNHTQTHPATRFWALRPRAMWNEIAQCQETLTRIVPQHSPRYFRPPAGHHNPFCVLTARALGLTTLMWTARGFDGTLRNMNQVLSRIRRKLTDDGIVLIHEATPLTVELTEKVAAMLAARAAQS